MTAKADAMRIVRSSVDPKTELLPTDFDLDDARRFAKRHAAAGISRVAVVRMPSLDARADAQGRVAVWLAIESLQVTGSFKVRGAFRALAKRKDEGARRVVAASAGNHGAGVAYAAKSLGMEALVLVPAYAPKKKTDAIAGLGATVMKIDGGYDATEREAIRLAAERGEPFVSAYDDIDVILGNGATLAMEIGEALRREATFASAVLAPIGGGGLATGLACAFANADGVLPGEKRRVWGVQSDASPSFAMSLERGAAVTSFEGGPTLADGLEGGIPVRAYERAAGVVAGAVVATEEAIADAMRFAFRDLGLVLEGSAAVALAPLLAGRAAELVADLTGEAREADKKHDVVCVLSGRNVDASRLAALL